MGLRKCPRCELNYIRDDEQLCNVCKRHMKGEAETDDVVTICTECGENPAAVCYVPEGSPPAGKS